MVQDDSRECRSCKPPVPGYRNETFHTLDYMVDIFLVPTRTRARSTLCQEVKRRRNKSGKFALLTGDEIATSISREIKAEHAYGKPGVFFYAAPEPEDFSDGGARKHTKKITAASGTNTTLSVTFAKGSSLPKFKLPARDCSTKNKCGRCEVHCQSTAECQSGVVCYNKGGKNLPVRGCTGIDGSLTKWCTIK